jgi:rhamnosyltransferase
VTDRRVVAVVTAFRPTDDLVSNVAELSKQVDAVVVVDDGSGPCFDRVLTALESDVVSTVRLSQNEGIAAALNAGVAAANPSSEDLLVTFDQDSRVPARFVTSLVQRWDDAASAGRRVGCVAPERFAGELQATGESARGPIQSGSLYSGEVLSRAGGFREDFFIDLVDTEYFLRLRSLGLEVLAAPGLDLPHNLGRTYPIALFGVPLRFRGRALTTSLSTPFRYFYRARNRVVLEREYRRVERRHLAQDRLMWVRHLVFVIAFARPRWSMFRLLRAGHRAGRAARMGRIPEAAQRLASGIRWRTAPLECGVDTPKPAGSAESG